MKTRRSKVPGHGWIAAAGLAAVVLFLVPVPSAEADAPCSGRYTISLDELTATDNDTGLIWQRTVPPDVYTWNEAKVHCESLSLAGADDWRLPSVFELQTLVDESRHHPAIDRAAFPYAPSEYFWSSSSRANKRCYVDFSNGRAYHDLVSVKYRVRCVR